MLKNYFSSMVKSIFDKDTTSDQDILVDKFSDFIVNSDLNELFLLTGYAGTGKTSLISAFVKAFSQAKIKSILMAPTGRAAKVFSSYSGKPTYTIHKKIYRQKATTDGFASFLLDKNLNTDTLFIVDEASMIANQTREKSIFGSGKLLDDLIEYVYSGTRCKLILIGDSAQLPPVGLDSSPALDKNNLETYLMNVNQVILKEVVRQKNKSGILYNATNLRTSLTYQYHQSLTLKLETKKFADFSNINGGELLDLLKNSYDKSGIEQTVVICRSNKICNKYNQGIRNQILYNEDQISIGDHLMIVKNNYSWLKDDEKKNMEFIANGDVVQIVRIKKYQNLYDFHFADVTLKFIDYQDMEIDVKILLDTLTIDAPSLNKENNQKLFFNVSEDYKHIRSKKKRWEGIKNNPYFNALQVKFSYAITCHKSQGGQWKNVFIDQGYLTEKHIDTEYMRWVYTAITRATERLYLINLKDEFIE